jgi:hypothetical protein
MKLAVGQYMGTCQYCGKVREIVIHCLLHCLAHAEAPHFYVETHRHDLFYFISDFMMSMQPAGYVRQSSRAHTALLKEDCPPPLLSAPNPSSMNPGQCPLDELTPPNVWLLCNRFSDPGCQLRNGPSIALFGTERMSALLGRSMVECFVGCVIICGLDSNEVLSPRHFMLS